MKKNGKKMQISLTSNPSTGYSWMLEISDEEIISLCDEKYLGGDANLAGIGGLTIFDFTGLKAGKVKLNFSYRRSKEDESIEYLEYSLEVKENGEISLIDFQGSYPERLIPKPFFTD